MIPKPHDQESVLLVIVLALMMLAVYAAALVYLIWVMTPAFFWHLVSFLERFRP